MKLLNRTHNQVCKKTIKQHFNFQRNFQFQHPFNTRTVRNFTNIIKINAAFCLKTFSVADLEFVF